MDRCISCKKSTGKAEDYRFHVLEVRTLKVRDLDREKKVQALGNFCDYDICSDCARQQLRQELSPVKACGKKLAGFGALLIAGIVLSALTLSLDLEKRIFLVLGVAAIACGVLGFVSSLKEANDRKNELESMPEKKALRNCAFTRMKLCAPRKDADANLTYIPVDEENMKWKKGDLMVLYELLPEIAVQAYERIHQEYHS